MVHTVMYFFLHANPLVIYFLVALILLLESSGVPIANSTLLLCTGALASQGHLDLWVLVLVAFLGSVMGACLAYILGLRGGRKIFLRMVTFFRVDVQKIDLVESWLRKSGAWMIFFSRITPYLRPYACFTAGISRMRFPRFLMLASSGSAIWCLAMLSIGWSLGRRWGLAVHLMQRYTLPTLCLIGLCIALYILGVFVIKRRLHLQSQPVLTMVGKDVKHNGHDILNV